MSSQSSQSSLQGYSSNSSNQEPPPPKQQKEQNADQKKQEKISKQQQQQQQKIKIEQSKFSSIKKSIKDQLKDSMKKKSTLDVEESTYNYEYSAYSKIPTKTTKTITTPKVTTTIKTTTAATTKTAKTINKTPSSQQNPSKLRKTKSKLRTSPGKKRKNKSEIINEHLIGKRVYNSPFIIKDFLTKGAFGSIFRGYHEKTKQLVAVKIESKFTERPQVHLEFGFYNLLGKHRGIPQIYCLGPVGNYTALVMDLLGPNLSQILEKCGGTFSLRTVIQLTIQFIGLIQYIHSQGLIYRDTKPENFLLGLENSTRWWMVHVVDLGFCKQWRLNDGSHIAFKYGKPLTGTVRYVSINNHRGYEQSRRDDMEAIGYMLIYFYKGKLPWMNIDATNIYEKYAHIGLLKQTTSFEILCKNMPNEFIEYMLHVISLGFEQEPQYNYFIKKFTNLLAERYGLELNDKVYDWTRSHTIKDPIFRSF